MKQNIHSIAHNLYRVTFLRIVSNARLATPIPSSPLSPAQQQTPSLPNISAESPEDLKRMVQAELAATPCHLLHHPVGHYILCYNVRHSLIRQM